MVLKNAPPSKTKKIWAWWQMIQPFIKWLTADKVMLASSGWESGNLLQGLLLDCFASATRLGQLTVYVIWSLNQFMNN